MKELIDFQHIWRFVKEWWARSLAIVLLTVFGFSVGELSAEARIMDDCKIMGNFRVGIQAFTCQVRR